MVSLTVFRIILGLDLFVMNGRIVLFFFIISFIFHFQMFYADCQCVVA